MTTRRNLLWTLLISFLGAIAVSTASVIYTGQSNEENNRQWCELLTTLDTAYSSPTSPPATPLGRKVAAAVHRLTISFECEG